MAYVSKCQWTWNDFKMEPGQPVPSDVPEGVIAAQLSLGHVAVVHSEAPEPEAKQEAEAPEPEAKQEAEAPEPEVKQEE